MSGSNGMLRGAGLTDEERLVLAAVENARNVEEVHVAGDGTVNVVLAKWARDLGFSTLEISKTFSSLEKKGWLLVTRKQNGAVLAKPLVRKEKAMGEKIVMGQPGGKGKLYSRSGDGSWPGTYVRPDGKTDRVKIRPEKANTTSAKAKYVEWCMAQDSKWEDEMKRKAGIKTEKKKGEGCGTAKSWLGESGSDGTAMNASSIEKNEAKENAMAQVTNGDGKIYVVMVCGGAALAWMDSFDKAVAVQDALTLAAQASGFAAKYDVVEVKKWTA